MSETPKDNIITSDFKVNSSIIRHLIFSQAGSLYKAILELAMNSLDAHAKMISIDFSDDMKKVTITDDGVGFTSVDEIEKLFGTFGFDHTTQEEVSRGRLYGKFGLGRAQCLAFGSTLWQTNNFSMKVDLKNNSTSNLPYSITAHDEVIHKGCRVEINLYETMSIHDKRHLVTELKTMAKYVKEELTVDGTIINDDVTEKKWTAISEDFWFAKAQSERGLTVYNKGIFVTRYTHSKFGVSGDLVSRVNNFDVNMARNDILQTSCPLWKKIPEFVKPFTIKKQQKKLTDQDRLFMISEVLKGDASYDDIKTKRLFKNADGKYFTLKQVINHAKGNVTIPDTNWDRFKGVAIHRRNVAFCFSCDFPDSLGFESLAEFIEALLASNLISTDYQVKLERLNVTDFTNASKAVNEKYDLIPYDSLTALDKARLNAIKVMYAELLYQQVYLEARSGKHNDLRDGDGLIDNINDKLERSISAGQSEVAVSWTDGSSYIAININNIRQAFENGLNGIFNLTTILAHEMCCKFSTMEAHDLDADFYERYHDLITDDGIQMFTIVGKCLEKYLRENTKIKRQLNETEVKNTFGTLERLFKRAT